MSDAEQEWVKWVTESINDLMGARVAQSTMLEAMLIAHPNPDALRQAWLELSSPRLASGAASKASGARRADDDLLYHLKRWGERLDQYHPR